MLRVLEVPKQLSTIERRDARSMTKTTLITACLVPIAGVCSAADSPPAAQITNGSVRLRVYLPDAKTGFYRGTRFDWAGVIGSAEYAGHDFFPQWFQRVDAGD